MGASASIDQVQIICSNVERAVPRTPAGDRDVKNCDRTKLQEEISRAEGEVKAFYEAAWAACVADDLLRETAELQDEFSPADPPRCALPFAFGVARRLLCCVCDFPSLGHERRRLPRRPARRLRGKRQHGQGVGLLR